MRLSAFLLFLLVSSSLYAQDDVSRWKQRARNVTIIRDNWGVPHVYGRTDADVVFGVLYAQCEDDFTRVEMNYLSALGRTAEVLGESALYEDLRARLYADTLRAKALYKKSPPAMRKLMDAFADGVNYYLFKHPETKPFVLKRFQPWFPLLFSEGSIGGDLTSISVPELKAFYENAKAPKEAVKEPVEPRGSNGFAIAPSRSESGHALLLINPHTSFYFRSEVQMVSDEGLHAYGAVTWGQFFIYQGFNEHCGWMHTSTFADAVDEYLETVAKKGDQFFYRHGDKWKPITKTNHTIYYKDGGQLKSKSFTSYATHHGPVIGEKDGKWKTIQMMDDPLHALQQSFMRTKATGYDGFKKVMKLNGNSSNNTVFADKQGNIAYWHGNFVPVRDKTFNWSLPVDGSNPSTDWKGLHAIDEIVQLKNPANGWIQNCNSTPFTSAGEYSPRKSDFPTYMAPDGQNYRAVNADRVLNREEKFTLDKLIAAAYDPSLAAFDKLIPALLAAVDGFDDTVRVSRIKDQLDVIRRWDRKYGVSSNGAALAIMWGRKLHAATLPKISAVDLANHPGDQVYIIDMMIATSSAEEKISLLEQVSKDFESQFGSWQIGWGDINRFQRLTGKIDERFDDRLPSLPIGQTASLWGSLAAYGSRSFDGSKKLYGYVGNSFVAAVEFGPRIKAKSIVTGGSSSNPNSKHFLDQASMYSTGQFKDILFYREDVEKNAEKTYHPGD